MAMVPPGEECLLEDLVREQGIGAAVFLPFVVTRLRGDAQARETAMAVTLRDVGYAGESRRMVRLRWLAESVPGAPLAVQERVVTEWAACGVACALLSLYAGMRVSQVAAEGDRFDYWVSDGEREFGLEVSGTMLNSVEDVEARHRAKVRQLRENPHGVDGYVAVGGFGVRHAILSFNRFTEEIP